MFCYFLFFLIRKMKNDKKKENEKKKILTRAVSDASVICTYVNIVISLDYIILHVLYTVTQNTINRIVQRAQM